MICKICGKDFSSVGLHVKVHGITARDYKVEFNIPLSTPLNEEHVSISRSKITKSFCSRERLVRIGVAAGKSRKGKSVGSMSLPECSRHKSRLKPNPRFYSLSKDIIKEYNTGISVLDLSLKYTSSKSTIYRYLHENNEGGIVPLHSSLTKENACEEYSKGMTPTELSKKYGVILSTLQNWIYKYRKQGANWLP